MARPWFGGCATGDSRSAWPTSRPDGGRPWVRRIAAPEGGIVEPPTGCWPAPGPPSRSGGTRSAEDAERASCRATPSTVHRGPNLVGEARNRSTTRALRLHRGGLLSGRGPGPGGARGLAVRWAAARTGTTGRTRSTGDSQTTGPDRRPDVPPVTGRDGVHRPGAPRRRGRAGEEPPATRRTALVAAGIVALLVVVALVVWLATRGTEPTTTAPGPSPSASYPSASASGTATGSATTSPTAQPAPGRRPRPAARRPPPTRTRRSRRPSPPGSPCPPRARTAGPPQGWSYAPCGTQVSAAGTSDFRRIAFEGPEDSRSQSLLVFPTEDAAGGYLATLQAAARRAPVRGRPRRHPGRRRETVDGDWDASLMVVLSYPVAEGGYSPGGDYTLAAPAPDRRSPSARATPSGPRATRRRPRPPSPRTAPRSTSSPRSSASSPTTAADLPPRPLVSDARERGDSGGPGSAHHGAGRGGVAARAAGRRSRGR